MATADTSPTAALMNEASPLFIRPPSVGNEETKSSDPQDHEPEPYRVEDKPADPPVGRFDDHPHDGLRRRHAVVSMRPSVGSGLEECF